MQITNFLGVYLYLRRYIAKDRFKQLTTIELKLK